MTGQNPALSGAYLGDADVRRVVLRGANFLDLEIVPDEGVSEDASLIPPYKSTELRLIKAKKPKILSKRAAVSDAGNTVARKPLP